MTQQIKDAGINWLQQVKHAWTYATTWVNGVFTLIALYVMSDQTVGARLMPFIPEQYREFAGLVLPLITFWIVQKAKKIDTNRTVSQTLLTRL